MRMLNVAFSMHDLVKNGTTAPAFVSRLWQWSITSVIYISTFRIQFILGDFARVLLFSSSVSPAFLFLCSASAGRKSLIFENRKQSRTVYGSFKLCVLIMSVWITNTRLFGELLLYNCFCNVKKNIFWRSCLLNYIKFGDKLLNFFAAWLL